MTSISVGAAITQSIQAANILDKLAATCPGTMQSFGISRDALKAALKGVRAGTKALQEMDVDKELYV